MIETRPQFNIYAYADDNLRKYILQTVYLEHKGARADIHTRTFPSVSRLNKEVNKSVKFAQENTYDYAVTFVTM